MDTMEKQSTTTSNQQPEGENYKSLKLYNFQNLPASVFFRILSSQNLKLLSKKSLNQLSQEQQSQLANQWIQIQEEYYKATDDQKYRSFISDASFESEQDREMMIIDSCSLVIDFETKYGIKIADYQAVLEQYGIYGTFDQIFRQIRQKRMKYKHYKATKEKNDNDTAKNDFYELVAIAGKTLGYHIPSNILLVEWCGILNTLKRIPDGRNNKED